MGPKLKLEFVSFKTGKMGFKSLGLHFCHWEWGFLGKI